MDVVVPFEGEDSFPDARKAKEIKYQHLKVLLRSRGFQKVEVDGFVGALGSWDPDKESVLRKLSINYRYAALFRSSAALKPSKAATEYGGRRLADSVYC